MKALVTIPHTGTRYVVSCIRAAGEIAVDGFAWNGRWNVVPYLHYHSNKRPPPELCVTTLRSPIETLAAHDQNNRDGTFNKMVRSMLKRCYERQAEAIERGTTAVWLSEGIRAIGAALEVPVTEVTERAGQRDYELKAALRSHDLAPDLWKVPEMLYWWLRDMGHIDKHYAALGGDIWWRD